MPSQWHLFLVVVAISSRSLDQRSLEIEDWGAGQTLEVRTSVASPSFTFLFRPITNISCLDPFIQSVLEGCGWSECYAIENTLWLYAAAFSKYQFLSTIRWSIDWNEQTVLWFNFQSTPNLTNNPIDLFYFQLELFQSARFETYLIQT